MKFFVTGVGGQLGHDVMNELAKRGYEGIGSDVAAAYSGIADGSPVTAMPYASLDITDAEAVERVLTRRIKPAYLEMNQKALRFGMQAEEVNNEDDR